MQILYEIQPTGTARTLRYTAGQGTTTQRKSIVAAQIAAHSQNSWNVKHTMNVK